MAELVAQYKKNPNMFIKIDFVQYIHKWLKEIKSQVDTVTYEGYLQYAEKHIIPYFEDKGLMIQDITIQDIENYYNVKSVSGRLDGKEGGLSIRTIKLHSAVLSLTFKKAVREGIIEKNPCDYARFPKVEKTQPIAKFYTVEQSKALLNAVVGKPIHDMIYVSTIYGLRRSELLGIRWSSIDFKSNTLTINHTVVLQTVVVKKDKTKNKSSMRIYPLLPDVKNIFLAIKKQQDDYRQIMGDCYIESDYVFTKFDGSTYYPSYPTHTLQKELKRNNLPHIRWHDLRHTAASMLLAKGWSMKDISEWLGHADIGTTMNIYGHINLEHKRELGTTLDGLLA